MFVKPVASGLRLASLYWHHKFQGSLIGRLAGVQIQSVCLTAFSAVRLLASFGVGVTNSQSLIGRLSVQ